MESQATTATREEYRVPKGPCVLILDRGKDDHVSLKTAMREHVPWLTPYVYAVDKTRDRTPDILKDDLYALLANTAREGAVMATV